MPFAHAESDDEEDSRHRCHGDEGCPFGGEEDDGEEGEGVDDAGERSFAAVIDIGRSAGDGTGGGKTAEERADDIGDTLGDEFRIAIVSVARETIGNDGREEGFDGTEEGDGRSRADEVADGLEVDVRKGGERKRGRDGVGAEFAADGSDIARGIPVGESDEDGGTEHGDDRAGDEADIESRPEEDDGEAGDADGERVGVTETEVLEEPEDFFRKFPRGRGIGTEAREVRDLRDHDCDSDAGGEAASDRPRDKLDEVAHAGEPHEEEDDARHDRGEKKARVAVFADDEEDDRDKGGGGSSDLDAATAESRDEEPGDDGSKNAEGRGGERGRSICRDAGDAEGKSQGESDETDGDARENLPGEREGREFAREEIEEAGVEAVEQRRVFHRVISLV